MNKTLHHIASHLDTLNEKVMLVEEDFMSLFYEFGWRLTEKCAFHSQQADGKDLNTSFF